MKQQIAIYLRLSLEDVDKRTNKIKDESNSIASIVIWIRTRFSAICLVKSSAMTVSPARTLIVLTLQR